MEDFLRRLRERKLVQWALAYGAAAFALLQGSDIVGHQFDWPEGVQRGITIALAVGFFVTLVVAWYHGEKGTQRVGSTELLIIAAVLVVGGAVMWHFESAPRKESTTAAPSAQSAESAPVSDKSIAVLPFENLSADKDNAYFANGMQDLILTKLAMIGDLKVISRTSTAKYASRPDDLKAIGAQLGVATILEGSVQKSGNQVLINLQLIDARTDNHIWAQVYSRTLDNIFGVEGEVAQSVADELKAKLSPADTARVAAVPTTNPEAWDLYLRALAHANRAQDQYALTRTEMPPAIELLQQALAKDPRFALAYSLLGRAQMYVYFFASERTDARLKTAKDAIDRALGLQPDLGEAHLGQALYWYWGFRDYERGHAELALARRALPHDVLVEALDAAIARRQGRWQQALDGLRQAQTYDPRNAQPAFEIGQTNAMLRRYAEAEQAYAHSVELSIDPTLALSRQVWITVIWKGDLAPLRAWLATLPPTTDEHRTSEGYYFELAWLSRDYAAAAKAVQESDSQGWTSTNGNTVLPRRLRLAWALAASGDAEKAAALYRELYEQALTDVHDRPGDWDRHLALGFAAAGLGMKDEARREAHRATELLPVERDAFAGPEVLSYAARIDARTGDHDAAIALLQRLMSIPAGLWISPAQLRLDPVWDPLRNDPRFVALTKQPIIEYKIPQETR